jgi:uncharacterized cofD-like protein
LKSTARIVLIGGGSGSRNLTLALCRAGHHVTRIVPAWDSGGSSKALREALGMLAIGDIRHALVTLAHGENRVGSVVRFFNARLSEDGAPTALRQEFNFYAHGVHPLLAAMTPRIRYKILEYLDVFEQAIGAGFDLRRGSIGNFVLSGAYLAHGRDINTAIRAFRVLCGISGQVWPSTTDAHVALCAQLRDASLVCGQDTITALPPAQAQVGIARVFLSQAGAAHEHAPPLNPPVADALARTDLVVFGPGSFFSSVLAHLGVHDLPAAVAQNAPGVPKVLVGNLLQCPETTGRSLAELVQAFVAAAPALGLTHVVAHHGWVPMDRVVGGWHYLPEGWGNATPAGLPIQRIVGDFEDPWARGRHDAVQLAATLTSLLAA